MIDKNISKIYIINLESSLYRFNNCLYELAKFGLDNFSFFKAIGPKHPSVISMFKNNKVKKFPPCFRCGLNVCNHENNILTPKQVANWLSFKSVMELILKNEDGLFLILEDDFYFKNEAPSIIKKLNKFIEKNNLAEIENPLLIRVGSHTISSKRINLKMKYFNIPTINENQYNMANPGMIVNKLFAKLFIDKLEVIENTSDAFIHKELCENEKVINFSIEPFPIGQLSWGLKENKFKSDINPTDIEKINAQHVETEEEYNNLFKLWVS